MSSIVSSVLHLTFGLLWKKFRNYTANQLKEGDLTDEQCREFVITELDDIKTKLDGLARKDLLSSISFLKEGLCLIKHSLDNSAAAATVQETEGGACQAKASISREASCLKRDRPALTEVCPSVFALSQAISSLSISSKESFESARECFKDARKNATKAFSNEALSVEDRIFATKLRVTSRILECLNNPNAAAVACKSYLEELHGMPAVREMFSVQLNGGMKSLFNKTRRFENVKSVTMINFAVFRFTRMFAVISLNLFNWPRIELDEQTYHPMIVNGNILTKMEESGESSPNQFTLNEFDDLTSHNSTYSAVNSKGEIISMKQCASRLVVKCTTGAKSRLFYTFPKTVIFLQVLSFILTLAIDGEDNVYIIVAAFKARHPNYNHKLLVLDAQGNMIRLFSLEWLNGNSSRRVSTMAVIKGKNIIIHQRYERFLHVCDSRGRQKYKIYHRTTEYGRVFLSISDNDEIIVAPLGDDVVYFYTENGELKRRFVVTEENSILNMTFNHATKEVIVLTQISLKQCCLSSYSVEASCVQRQTFLLPICGFLFTLTSHPNGPVAFTYSEGVLHLQ